MVKPLRVAIVLGTRPEAIKMAPVALALRQSPRFETIVCSTGQHQHMVMPVLDFFGVVPDHNLEVMKPGQDLNSLFSSTIRKMGDILTQMKPDRVLVHGDTTTAGAAALAAFHLRIPVGHVEAGLRTHNMQEPWPEELNRRLVDLVCDQLYAPTEESAANLRSEQLGNSRIVVTGNTVIDALLLAAQRLDSDRELNRKFEQQFSFLPSDKKIVLITGHRRENFGTGFENICRAIQKLAARKDVEFVYPVHLNPNVREPVGRLLKGLSNVHLIEPVGYPEFVYLMRRSFLILTDSGGVQEEAPSLGKHVLVMRNVTERPEAVRAGTVKLVGTAFESIVQNMTDYLDRTHSGHPPINPYGDGQAAKRIVEELLR